MTRLGEDTRRSAGRTLGELVVPAEAQRAAVTVIAVGNEAMFEIARADGIDNASSTAVPPETAPERVPTISFDAQRVADFARTQYGIRVSDVKTINGRINGDANVLRVEFVPQERDENTAIRELLLICAVTFGMDASRSVDTVVALVTDSQSLPWMSVRVDMGAFQAVQSGEITLSQWKKQAEIQRF